MKLFSNKILFFINRSLKLLKIENQMANNPSVRESTREGISC